MRHFARIQVEPMASWPYPETTHRKASPFRGRHSDTLEALNRELVQLDAHLRGVVAMRVVTPEGNLRRDGMLRAGAVISHPGVALAFQSRHGSLEIYCDKFGSQFNGTSWQANLRAIALGLEALRRVDRYGIGGTGEQYQGWRQIEAKPVTSESLRHRLAEIAGWPLDYLSGSGVLDTELLKKAKAASHPDRHGGDRALWDEVERIARKLGF